MIEIIQLAAQAGFTAFQHLDFLLDRSQPLAGVVDQRLIDPRHPLGGVQRGGLVSTLHLLEPIGGGLRFLQPEFLGQPQPLFPILGAVVEKLAGGFFRLAQRVELAGNFIPVAAIFGETGDLQVVPDDEAELRELRIEFVALAQRGLVIGAGLGVLKTKLLQLGLP